ncbi:peptidoglycan/LPS O-acetylase OafA/YrhL [Microbacterium resistens]|uniref:Peptidoglycan/LPS O-acetylase OafA/YrhL n=1 Tax=Microbacterium resistens TaxID=156977 RepID=A0ABU1SB75_9MICO|nr:acyltransferase family protein [Microbacterium resistens]MDR6866183.1 peptidoglycan/LPS O-acetylase OafA/YrhL [Microbacterium resistens]
MRERVVNGHGHRVRSEIQALRALAVLLVVVYHLWPERLTGGYVGVDVFFVISGFLITLHIARGIQSDRGFSLREFYARRARRLLPASLLVLLLVGAVTLVLMPQTLWEDFGTQIAASALYVENWVLNARAVDYLALGAQPSPVQHFWSLSAEEQFYLVWPLLLLVAAVLAVKAGKRRIFGLVLAMACVTLLSLSYSVFATATDPASAYFVTPTRAWEFGAGGLAALLLPDLVGHERIRTVLAWGGYAGIFVAAFLFDSATPFPGYAALLPVVATVLVIVAGDPRTRLTPAFLTGRRPVQFVGGISYSMYLWHWPLIVFVPILASGVGTSLTTVQKVIIFGATLVLGWLSKKYIEDPFIGDGLPARWRRPRVTFTAVAAGMVIVAAVGVTGAVTVGSRASAATALVAQSLQSDDASCLGAATLVEEGCADFATDLVIPDPVIARQDLVAQDCQQRAGRAEVIRCEFGPEDGGTRVVLLGDSHANQWLPALTAIAEKRDWHLTTYFKSSCPFSVADFRNPSCTEWNAAVRAELEASRFDIAIVASGSGLEAIAAKQDALETATAGVVGAWGSLTATGARIIPIADTPRPDRAGITDPPSCVAEGRDCDLPANKALGDDPLVEGAKASGIPIIDMNDLLCSAGVCPAIIGGVLAYRDGNHLTGAYVTTLTPYLDERIHAPRG